MKLLRTAKQIASCTDNEKFQCGKFHKAECETAFTTVINNQSIDLLNLMSVNYIYLCVLKYSVIQKGRLNFVRLYFLNYTRYVNDLHNI